MMTTPIDASAAPLDSHTRMARRGAQRVPAVNAWLHVNASPTETGERPEPVLTAAAQRHPK